MNKSLKKENRNQVAETCEILGIHRKTLKAYTDEGHIKCGFRRSNGRKFYEGKEILRFWSAQM